MRRWYSPISATLLLVFCLAMLLAIPPLCLKAHVERPIPAGGWLAIGVGLLVPVIGLYSGVALFVNRSEILIEGGTLSHRHAPLPWFGK